MAGNKLIDPFLENLPIIYQIPFDLIAGTKS